MKKIMILSSTYTGHGHASIAQSITEHLDMYEDVEYKVVDGFSLMGKAGIEMSKMYGPITRGARELWKVSYTIINQHPRVLTNPITVAIHDGLLRQLGQFMPDLILTVHPFFNGSVIDVLESYDLDIPVYALQADPINIHGAWCDPRATVTLCPTAEAYQSSIQHGMPTERMEVCGFPSRKQFTDAARVRDSLTYDGEGPIHCLLMSGGEGSGDILKYAEYLLRYVDCRLSIVCGRNQKLKRDIEEELSDYWGRVEVHGFVTNIDELMLASHLVIARGSPNTLMEAVVLGVPLLITGALPGQEADNPAVFVVHNLAAVCENAESLPAIVKALMADGGKRLKDIQASQRAYRNLDTAANIAARIYRDAVPVERHVPRKRFMVSSSRVRRRRRRHSTP